MRVSNKPKRQIYQKSHVSTQCNTVQHTATHCNTLQHTATHCNPLQPTAAHCNTLQHTATHCNTLQHTTSHCNTLRHTATHCITLQHTATLYSVFQSTNARSIRNYTLKFWEYEWFSNPEKNKKTILKKTKKTKARLIRDRSSGVFVESVSACDNI